MTARENLIERIEAVFNPPKGHVPTPLIAHAADCALLLEALRAVPQWIPVSEWLPERERLRNIEHLAWHVCESSSDDTDMPNSALVDDAALKELCDALPMEHPDAEIGALGNQSHEVGSAPSAAIEPTPPSMPDAKEDNSHG